MPNERLLQMQLDDIDCNKDINNGYIEIRGFYTDYTIEELTIISKHVFQYKNLISVTFDEFKAVVIPDVNLDHIICLEFTNIEEEIILDESITIPNIEYLTISTIYPLNIDFIYRHKTLIDLNLNTMNELDGHHIYIDNRLCNLTNLRILSISGYFTLDIDEIYKLSKLESIVFDIFCKYNIPDTLADIETLTEIDFGWTTINGIPEFIYRMVRDKELKIIIMKEDIVKYKLPDNIRIYIHQGFGYKDAVDITDKLNELNKDNIYYTRIKSAKK